jgi:enamine deaminase RidA (YjgF/YER057c/UK114 family)
MTRIENFDARPGGPGSASLPYSCAVRAGDFVFTSRQIPAKGTALIAANSIVNCMGEPLALAGAGFADVVKCPVWLQDLRDFTSFNQVYASYFRESPPARSCVHSGLMVAGKVGVEAVAYVGGREQTGR